MASVSELEVTTFSIDDTQYPFDLAKHAAINKGDLNSEFAEHSAVFAFYATAFELAKEHEARCKAEKEATYAKADIWVRNQANNAEKKLTEKMVENMAMIQQEYIDAQNKHITAARNVGLLKAAVDALSTKKDMLISLGAMIRAEGDSTISINKKLENAKSIMKGHV